MSQINVSIPKFEIMKNDIALLENLKILEKIIRTCYRSEDKITEESYIRMISLILSRGHGAMLEHMSITIKFLVDRGCYSDDTEVLTDTGWKLFDDVKDEDLLFCLDDSGKVSFEKQTEKKIKKWFNGDLLHFETKSIDLLVTPDHNMWVYDYDKRSEETKTWKFLKADELTNNRYVFDKTSSSWEGHIGEVFLDQHPTKKHAFPKRVFTEDELQYLWELLGLWVTDGSYNKSSGSGSSIVITQTKKKGVDRIKHLCENLKFKYSVAGPNIKIGNLQLLNFVENLFGEGPKSLTSFVPKIIKDSPSNLIKNFLDGVVLGNGSVKNCGYSCVYTASKVFADDLQELFVKIGFSANIRVCKPRNRVFPGKTEETVCTKTTFVVSICRERRSKPMLDKRCATNFSTKNKYEGYVYCLTVPGHRLYVRRNNKAVWCGNCTHEFVRHRIAAFAQSSTRYITYKDGLTVVKPSHIPSRIIEEVSDFTIQYFSEFIGKLEDPEEIHTYSEAFFFLNSCRTSFLNYCARLDNGASMSEARGSLCNHTAAELVVTANVREWLHIFYLRAANDAHPDFRHVMRALKRVLNKISPIFFDDTNSTNGGVPVKVANSTYLVADNCFESGDLTTNIFIDATEIGSTSAIMHV